jgi:hypothetical protein
MTRCVLPDTVSGQREEEERREQAKRNLQLHPQLPGIREGAGMSRQLKGAGAEERCN